MLDVGLPRIDGFEVCRRIRQTGQTPVILLTALHDDDHAVQGVRLGADDSVTKPFSPRPLATRSCAIWRRGAGGDKPEPVRELRVGDLVLDVEGREVSRGGRTVRLTPLEFRILQLLASNAGRGVSATRRVQYAGAMTAAMPRC